MIQSKHRIYCYGKIIAGPDRELFNTAVLMVSIPFGIYAGLVLPWVWIHISPIVVALNALLFLISIGTLFKSSFTDPGIIPRSSNSIAQQIARHHEESLGESNAESEEEVEEGDIEASTNDLAAEQPLLRTPSVPKRIKMTVDIDGSPTIIKYCGTPADASVLAYKQETCEILRPPRTSHCRVCDACVERFDHHCVWIGNCVGKRNYQTFLMFVCTTFLMLLVGSIICGVQAVVVIIQHKDTEDAWPGIKYGLSAYPPDNILPSLSCLIYSLMLLFPLGTMSLYTISMAMSETTTNEEGTYDAYTHNPYRRNWARNVLSLCFPPDWPTLLPFPLVKMPKGMIAAQE